ncbi:HNH endonuclease [Halosimplex rubrum]|uniref:HNH endonuclease n=1 Tax=Halosimplex rubrum TaxID=869889 RepID=A0A7D5P3A9_9EURY|nr:HNH endonuclease [Halosimplex rubrum]QLH79717.1 HNH endonuclease [Halosimplex rubrum]
MAGDWTASRFSGEFSADTKQNLRDLYSNRCAICRQRYESPFGHPETEAAHIHPAQHGGPDRETNGLLLCRRCHWGFDSGWLSLDGDRRIVVAGDETVSGYDYFNQFRDQSLLTPSTADLRPAERFIEVHRKLFGFEPIERGDRLTIGGLRSGELSLADGRRVCIEGAPDEALVVNCTVTAVGSEQVRCAHHRTLETRPATGPEIPDTPFDNTTEVSFDELSNRIQELKDDYVGVTQKWEWGRIFRKARIKSGLSYEEIAEKIDLEGASGLQIERSERVYEMFPEREFEEDGLSYSAIAELQRVFDSTDDIRVAYDCIIETGHPLTVKETRVWVEIMMADADVTREIVREEVETYEELRRGDPSESVRRILEVHAKYESAYEWE